MRISATLLFGSAIVSAVATPVRIVVVEKINFDEGAPAFAARIGHAGANANHDSSTPMEDGPVSFVPIPIPMSPEAEMEPPFADRPREIELGEGFVQEACDQSIRNTIQRLGDYFREIIGLPAVASYTTCSKIVPVSHPAILPCHTKDNEAVPEVITDDGPMNILPFPWTPGPVVHVASIPPSRRIRNPSMWLHRQRPATFSGRLQKALYMLSPWEGRALAFVVGCGIGVLLRMFYVFAVLGIRAFRTKEQPVQLEPLFDEEEDADKDRPLEPVYNEKE